MGKEVGITLYALMRIPSSMPEQGSEPQVPSSDDGSGSGGLDVGTKEYKDKDREIRDKSQKSSH